MAKKVTTNKKVAKKKKAKVKKKTVSMVERHRGAIKILECEVIELSAKLKSAGAEVEGLKRSNKRHIEARKKQEEDLLMAHRIGAAFRLQREEAQDNAAGGLAWGTKLQEDIEGQRPQVAVGRAMESLGKLVKSISEFSNQLKKGEKVVPEKGGIVQ